MFMAYKQLNTNETIH